MAHSSAANAAPSYAPSHTLTWRIVERGEEQEEGVVARGGKLRRGRGVKGIEPNIGCGLGCDGLLRARAQVFTSSSRIEIPMRHLEVDMGV
jgi:hypothetical protein